MEEEEIQEADVLLWPDQPSDHRSVVVSCEVEGDLARDSRRPSVILAEVAVAVAELSSPPVRVPAGSRKRRSDDDLQEHGRGYTDDAKRAANGFALPLHILVDDRRRRLGGGKTAAYSMCAGKGRTLKGRDLRTVRNLVLHMTGFIEK